MDEAIAGGSMKLVEFGIVGVFCLLFIGAIIWLTKHQSSLQEKLLSAKDEQIKNLQETVDKHVANQDKNIAAMSANVTRLIDLYTHMHESVKEIPDKILSKIK